MRRKRYPVSPIPVLEQSREELTPAEQAVLRRGGLVFEEQPGPDPLAETAAKFAAIISSSLTTSEVGKRLRTCRCAQ